MAVIAVIFLWLSYDWEGKVFSPALIVMALILISLFAFAQSRGGEKERIAAAVTNFETYQADDGFIYFYEGRVRLKKENLPILRGADNRPTAILISDFECPHCRDLRIELEKYVAESNGGLNVIFLPGYETGEAMELNLQLLILWRADPDFHDTAVSKLLYGEIPPTKDALSNYVKENYQGNYNLDQKTHFHWATEVLKQSRKLVILNSVVTGSQTLPQIMIGDQVISGAPKIATIKNLADQTETGFATGVPQIIPDPTPDSIESPAEVGIKYESEIINLGRLVEGEEKELVYRLENLLDSPLEISASSSCGCTRIFGAEQTIEPYGKGEISLVFNSQDLDGVSEKNIAIRTNRSEKMHLLSMVAEVWSPVKAVPNKIVSTHIMEGDKTPVLNVLLAITEPDSVTLGEPSSETGKTSVKIKKIAGKHNYQLDLHIVDDSTGTHQDIIHLPLGHPEMPELKIPVYYRIAKPLAVNPIEFVPERVRQGEPLTFSIMCADQDFENFLVESIIYEGAQNGLELDWNQSQKGKRVTFSVLVSDEFNFQKAETAGEKILIKTNHPKMPEISVPIRGKVTVTQ